MRGAIKRFNTIKGPQALGPYCTVTIHNGLMYVSGQLGIDPKSLELVSDSVEDQTRRAMDNLSIILGQTNCKFDDILKTTIFLKHMSDFGKVNQIYASYFKTEHPARICVAVSELPKNAKFEIDAIVACAQPKL